MSLSACGCFEFSSRFFNCLEQKQKKLQSNQIKSYQITSHQLVHASFLSSHTYVCLVKGTDSVATLLTTPFISSTSTFLSQFYISTLNNHDQSIPKLSSHVRHITPPRFKQSITVFICAARFRRYCIQKFTLNFGSFVPSIPFIDDHDPTRLLQSAGFTSNSSSQLHVLSWTNSRNRISYHRNGAPLPQWGEERLRSRRSRMIGTVQCMFSLCECNPRRKMLTPLSQDLFEAQRGSVQEGA